MKIKYWITITITSIISIAILPVNSQNILIADSGAFSQFGSYSWEKRVNKYKDYYIKPKQERNKRKPFWMRQHEAENQKVDPQKAQNLNSDLKSQDINAEF